MEYINLKFTKRGVTHYYAIAIYDCNKQINAGEIYVSKDGNEYKLQNCSPSDVSIVNENSKTRKWKYCFKIAQIIETDENGMTRFYLCIDKDRKFIYIYRTDQDCKPVFDEVRQRYTSTKVKTGSGNMILPRGKCVLYDEKPFIGFDISKITNKDLCLIEGDALAWLKLEKQHYE